MPGCAAYIRCRKACAIHREIEFAPFYLRLQAKNVLIFEASVSNISVFLRLDCNVLSYCLLNCKSFNINNLKT